MVRETASPTGQAAPVQVPRPGSQKALPVQTGPGRVGQGVHRVQWAFQALALPVSSVQVPPSAREQKRVCSVLPLLQEQALALPVFSVQAPPSVREQKQVCSVLPLLREPLLWVVSEPGLGQVLQVLRRPFQTDGRICRSIFVPLNVQEHRNVDILS